MRAPRLRSAPALAALIASGFVAASLASPAIAEPDRGDQRDDPAALFLLAAAQQAPAAVGYVGVQYVSVWGPGGTASQVVDVTHAPKIGTVVHLRGTAGTPAGKLFTAAGDGDATTPGSVTEGPAALLAGNYTLAVVGHEPVAGRPCVVVEATRSGGTIAARFWLDEATGLMLRREVFDRAGGIVKASAFIKIRLGTVRIDDAGRSPSVAALGDPVSIAARAELRDAGWSAPETVAPGLILYDARKSEGDTGSVVHLSYSDGLSTVSVFQQRGHLDVEKLHGHRKVDIGGASIYVWDGIPFRASWSADGLVYTVLADAPEDVARAVIEDLPRENTDDGVAARVGRGVGRVASWFNPFG